MKNKRYILYLSYLILIACIIRLFINNDAVIRGIGISMLICVMLLGYFIGKQIKNKQ